MNKLEGPESWVMVFLFFQVFYNFLFSTLNSSLQYLLHKSNSQGRSEAYESGRPKHLSSKDSFADTTLGLFRHFTENETKHLFFFSLLNRSTDTQSIFHRSKKSKCVYRTIQRLKYCSAKYPHHLSSLWVITISIYDLHQSFLCMQTKLLWSSWYGVGHPDFLRI